MKVPDELLAAVPQRGQVRWIGVRPAARAEMLELQAVDVCKLMRECAQRAARAAVLKIALHMMMPSFL